jgi:hypothetical protein
VNKPSSDAEFFSTLRIQTVRAWDRMSEPPPNFYGPYWQRGTKWGPALTKHGLSDVEATLGVTLPEEYARFLLELHTTDRPMLMRSHEGSGSTRIVEIPSFMNWPLVLPTLTRRLESTTNTLVDSIVDAGAWSLSWGNQPSSADERRARVRGLIDAGPKLVPVFGHRYLVASVETVVLSIVGSDIIVFADGFRNYLRNELSDLLKVPRSIPRLVPRIPFWSDLIAAL